MAKQISPSKKWSLLTLSQMLLILALNGGLCAHQPKKSVINLTVDLAGHSGLLRLPLIAFASKAMEQSLHICLLRMCSLAATPAAVVAMVATQAQLGVGLRALDPSVVATTTTIRCATPTIYPTAITTQLANMLPAPHFLHTQPQRAHQLAIQLAPTMFPTLLINIMLSVAMVCLPIPA